MSAAAPASLSPGTLSRQLVLRVMALVALVTLLLSGLTVATMHAILQKQQDDQLIELASRPTMPGNLDRRHDGRQDGSLEVRPAYSGRISSGSYIGTLASVQQGDTTATLTDDQKTAALGVTQSPATVNLPGLGLYRVYTFTDPTGRRGAVGLPASLTNGPILALLAADTGFLVLAIGSAFLVTRFLVGRSLQPLQRLASTAHAVSALDLASGEVNLSQRVPDADTDERSEVGRVGTAFNHMLDNVENALEARQESETKVRQFVADASHELRNPLASIRGYAELTRRERDEVPPNTAFALSRIEAESARMSALVEDLLLLARLDSGPAVGLSREEVPLVELVSNAVADAQVAGPEHDWSLDLPEAEVMAVADPFRLHQVVANLLANARAHTPPGTHVVTTLRAQGDEAVIVVSDDGPGIPPSIRGTVFERFTRADASRVRTDGTQSTGLGLAIVAAVMKAHGGSASVESSDAGTAFTIRVPLAQRET